MLDLESLQYIPGGTKELFYLSLCNYKLAKLDEKDILAAITQLGLYIIMRVP